MNRITEEMAVQGTNGYTGTYTYDLAGNRTLRHMEVNQSDLYTQYEYYPGTDRLQKELFTTSLAGMFPWGGDRMYAYADGTYKRAGSEQRIGRGWAFMLGLPSKWSRVVFIAVMALLPLVALIPVWIKAFCRRRSQRNKRKNNLQKISVYLCGLCGQWRRCLCVLLAYVFLVGPESFQTLVQADIYYYNLGASTWGKAGNNFSYFYDENGSLTYTFHAVYESLSTALASSTDYDGYAYNLQGRLMTLTKRRNSVIETIGQPH